METGFDEAFQRLAKLQGGDPAFFVLAVHSFIEGVLRKRVRLEDPDDDSFGDFIDEFKRGLLSHTREYIHDLGVLHLLKMQHQLTNDARHQFAAATTEEARAATQHLRKFCSLAGIQKSEALEGVLKYLEAWEDQRSHGALIREVQDLGMRLQIERRSSSEMTARVAALDAVKAEVGQLKEERRRLDRALAEATAAKDARAEKLVALRDEMKLLTAQLKTAQDRSAELADARDYLDHMKRLTVLARSRSDYERTLVRPSHEQSLVLEAIKLDADFLIKGSAGTGKTLVLLMAIKKAKGAGAQAALDLAETRASTVLLTYTTTLVKYDRYVSSILSPDMGADLIQTADAFILERLRAVEAQAEINFTLIKELAERHAPEGILPKDLHAEAEDFLWGRDLSREDYIENMAERRGMRRQLLRPERERYWAACEAMGAEMEASQRYSKAYSRRILLRAIAASPADPRFRVADYIFVDEAQDLSIADLKVLKACARRALVLAGDSDQSIYQPGFAFKAAGVAISGRTRILHTNFRNTLPIHDLAERFRASSTELDASSDPEAFRDGPAPELFTAPDRAALLELLTSRVDLLVRGLGYDPDNIAILVPMVDDIKFVSSGLAKAGYASSDIRDGSFEFESAGALRVSTLHSAKGLDFPVVLLFLYRQPFFGSGFDEATTESMTRNLVYVAMTRAMDQLSVFALEEPSSTVIQGLMRCFGKAAEAATSASDLKE